MLVSHINIDRTKSFDLGSAGFEDEDGWTIETTDRRSVLLTGLDVSSIQLEHWLGDEGGMIGSSERLRRLEESGYISLDASILEALWNSPQFIPDQWKRSGESLVRILFEGTRFRNKHGSLVVLCLCWYGGHWSCGRVSIKGNLHSRTDLSAILPKP